MYTVSKEDGSLNKDGRVCYCIYTETSCTTSCAAFEERAKDRAFLYCCGREIIAKPEMPKETPPVAADKGYDPLGLYVDPTKPVLRKKMATAKRRTK